MCYGVMGFLESPGSHIGFDTNLKDNMKGFCKTAQIPKKSSKSYFVSTDWPGKNGLKLSPLKFNIHFMPFVPVLWKHAKICINWYFENPTSWFCFKVKAT